MSRASAAIPYVRVEADACAVLSICPADIPSYRQTDGNGSIEEHGQLSAVSYKANWLLNAAHACRRRLPATAASVCIQQQ